MGFKDEVNGDEVNGDSELLSWMPFLSIFKFKFKM